MPQETVVTSPLDSRYTAHRDAERRRQETREWLQQREQELGTVKDAPSVAPAQPNNKYRGTEAPALVS
jgi:hypothetical protein